MKFASDKNVLSRVRRWVLTAPLVFGLGLLSSVGSPAQEDTWQCMEMEGRCFYMIQCGCFCAPGGFLDFDQPYMIIICLTCCR